ncbi:imm11 family protein [Archangium gephyra]|uniref:imm11 family protein n=1 Tax=Archangium gephyra TaxID=48 RepID=UPI003B7E7E8B
MNYKILKVPPLEELGYIEQEVKGVTQAWRLGEGERMGNKFPTQASYPLSKNRKGMKLTDFIPNKFSRLIVSEKVRKLLEAEPLDIEWLPVSIIDKKDRVVDVPYAIAHVLGTVDCVDLERSEYDRSSFSPEQFLVIRRLVLREDKIPEQRSLFRIKEYPRAFIIRVDLLEKLAAAGITGLGMLDLDSPVML